MAEKPYKARKTSTRGHLAQGLLRLVVMQKRASLFGFEAMLLLEGRFSGVAKVLIVDDDRDICMVLSELLEEEGFEIRCARNGQEALEILTREPGWVILLDLYMPQMDGREVLRQLQRDPDLQKDNHVVLMTASMPHTRLRLAFPVELVPQVLPKPFELEEVVGVVHKLAS